MTSEMAIGQVAEATGVAVSVIRYYDEFGLVTAARRVGGQRRFNPEVVGRVMFVRRAQDAGFSLDDIKALLDDQRHDWLELVDRHLDGLKRRRQQLDEVISTLEEARRCDCDVVATCPRVSAC